MEVMGLMLGEFVDEFTIVCVDVFAMPQSGTGVSVEAVDPVFQTKVSNSSNNACTVCSQRCRCFRKSRLGIS